MDGVTPTSLPGATAVDDSGAEAAGAMPVPRLTPSTFAMLPMPTNAADWEATRFYDKTYIGWNVPPRDWHGKAHYMTVLRDDLSALAATREKLASFLCDPEY